MLAAFEYPATPAILAEVGARVRARRRALRMTQDALAEAMGGPPVGSYVSRIELAKLDIEIRTLGRLAAGLGVTPADLLPDRPERTTDVNPPRRLAPVGALPRWTERRGRPCVPAAPALFEGNLLDTLGHRVRQQREMLHMTQRRFAEWAGFDLGYLSRIERGRHSVRISTLIRLADTLSADMRDLLATDAEPRVQHAPCRLPAVGIAVGTTSVPATLERVGRYPFTKVASHDRR